jgi:hypothetical protein
VDGRHALPVFVLFRRAFNGLGVLSGNQALMNMRELRLAQG